MPQITYSDSTTVYGKEGQTVLQASIQNGIDHVHACGGNGRCTTCRIRIVKGEENCPEPEKYEREALQMRGYDSSTRLACQLRPTGPIEICCLLTEHPLHNPVQYDGSAMEIDLAVLFVDLREFTPFAERSLPFDVVHLLNSYFDSVGTIVESNRGRIVAFQGDGVLCIFDDSDAKVAASSAVQAARQIVGAINTFSDYALEQFSYDTKVGIGIAFGKAVVGRLGYYNHSTLNVVGDVVNTASRIQEYTKVCGAKVLVDERVQALACSEFSFGTCEEADLKGKSCSQGLYSLDC